MTMPIKKINAVNLGELEALAKERLSPMAFDYFVSGACDEITLRDNMRAYDRIQLSPHMLVDVSKRNLSTELFGQKITMPVLVAPTAFHKLAHPEGELATARAAARAGTIYTLSTLATSSVEEVAATADGTMWFQLYVYKDRSVTQSLVERAEAAGAKAIVLTVDSPILGRRERDVRNRFHLPPQLSVANLICEGLQELPSEGGESGLATYIASLYDTAFTWRDVEWLCSLTKLPVLVKGILRADDAVKSLDYGARGVIVSNHGGRQLDTVPATITVLPKIVEAIDGRVDVLIDGGIRRGTDVIKALAYGAKAVLIGRPVLWGLAIDGEEGVHCVLEMLRAELDLAMALLGCPSVAELSPDFIA
jgi:4-hydroxymandelate oxidase